MTKISVEIGRETDWRWIAEIKPIRGVPAVLAYGSSRRAALCRALAVAHRAIADQIEAGDHFPEEDHGRKPQN